MIPRGELDSMSKKMKEKRNNFGENGMQSLGGLTPDLVSVLKSLSKIMLQSKLSKHSRIIIKVKLYGRKASGISSELNASQ